MTPMEKLELQMQESDDGSVVVDLPDDEQQEEANDNPKQNTEFRTEDDDGEYSSNVDEERQRIREQRREERRNKKVIHREKARENYALINSQRKEIEQLREEVAKLNKRTTGAELARMDKAIEDAGVQLEYAKMKLQEAVDSSNGQMAIQANEMLYEAQRNIESLTNFKKQAMQSNTQPKQNIEVPSTRTQMLMNQWMEENAWYNPAEESQERDITISIDKQLVREGYNPETEEYWDELTYRTQKYIPQAKNTVYNESNNRNQRPRSVVTGSGRESIASANPKGYVISPERVAAMKETGDWDNPVRKKKMIEYYRNFDRQNKG